VHECLQCKGICGGRHSRWGCCRGDRLFLGNEESGQKCAILYTIGENCRRLGINPEEYLTDALTRLPGMLAKDASALTRALLCNLFLPLPSPVSTFHPGNNLNKKSKNHLDSL
jgi:hypothetical protein